MTGQGDAITGGQSHLVQQGEAGQAGAVVKAQITRQGSPTSSRSVSFLCDETSDVTSQGPTAERQANTYMYKDAFLFLSCINYMHGHL